MTDPVIGQVRLAQAEESPEESAEITQLAEAEQLYQQVVQLYQQGRYADVIPLAQRVLEIRETALGETHPNVATGLNNLAELYRAQGNDAEAERILQRLRQIRETTQ